MFYKMSLKEKIIFIFLSIITLGVFAMITLKKGKIEKKTELSAVDKPKTNPKKLVENLGGKDNIQGVEYTHKKIKVFIKDNSKINTENLEKMKGISGIMISSKSISLIVGNQAKVLSKSLEIN